MPTYNLPQFTEIESKVIGPLTFKQFIFLLIAGGICFILYNILPSFISIPLILVVFGIGVAFAFVKVSGIPLYEFILHGLNFLLAPKKGVWTKKKRGNLVTSEIEFKKIEKPITSVKLKKGGNLKNLLMKIETKK